LGITAILFILGIGIFGIAQWISSKNMLEKLAVNSLEYRTKEIVKKNPTLAVSMAGAYVEKKENSFVKKIYETVKNSLSREQEIAWVQNLRKSLHQEISNQHLYQANLQQVRGNDITSAHFSPSEKRIVTVANGLVVQLWDLEGNLQKILKNSLSKLLLLHSFLRITFWSAM
jgi:WD40 repeat protein